jgi:hypothetical protein
MHENISCAEISGLGYLNWNVNKLDIERQVKPGASGKRSGKERKVIRGLHKVFTMTFGDKKGGEEERTSRTTLETLSLFIPQDHDSRSMLKRTESLLLLGFFFALCRKLRNN